MVAGCSDTSNLWCAGIATPAGIPTLACVSDSMPCSGAWPPFRARLRATADSNCPEVMEGNSVVRDMRHEPALSDSHMSREHVRIRVIATVLSPERYRRIFE